MESNQSTEESFEREEVVADGAWRKFRSGSWCRAIDVRDFIVRNVTSYIGDEGFLEGPTDRTTLLWAKVSELMEEESKRGILDADTKTVSSITSHIPGFIEPDLEVIVGLQTDKPLKRALMPLGGLRVAKQSIESYGYHLDPATEEIFSKHRKTHNDGVFDVYTEDMRAARTSGIITGLPDAYGRGRIIGDYRRVALYGVDRLIEDKKREKHELESASMDENTIRLREELSEQIRALRELKALGTSYGFNLGVPANDAREAIQWTYLAYLGAVKEQNGAAMSIGRVSSFLDIYIERDLAAGALTEREAQEMIDQLVMKLRMVRFARTPDYNELFSGDPTWVTEVLGGMTADGRTLVTKNSFRFLHTLYNLGPAPEPNLTILWSEALPVGFKNYCAKVSIDKSSIQYENDDLMRPVYGDDYGIACCVSAMKIGKQMQFFGARANLAKALLYAINGGRDEMSGEQVGRKSRGITSDVLSYEAVLTELDHTLEWLAELYVNTLNVIHYMHDKYCYERLEMALHDRDVVRLCATGLAGLSTAVDALSAMKYAKVHALRDESGLVKKYEIEGDFPTYGNNDDRADSIAVDLVKRFMSKLRKQATYRNSVPTLSILTITSNVVYGKKTGDTPDGRKAGEPLAPGANPYHGRDKRGAIAAMSSVAKIPYDDAADGISYTFSITPSALGNRAEDRVVNLTGLLDGYFGQGGHHININVLSREMLLEAIEYPDRYPQLTVRVSGYAVHFHKLTREQQEEVVSRTFYDRM